MFEQINDEIFKEKDDDKYSSEDEDENDYNKIKYEKKRTKDINYMNIIINKNIYKIIDDEEFLDKKCTYFLLSVINQIEETKIGIHNFKFEVYHIGSIKKDGISFKIEIIKINSLIKRDNINLEIDKKVYSLELCPGINFTYDQRAIDQTNKLEVKLNCFDFYEEFYIYSRLISNYDVKSFLVSKALNIFNEINKNLTFSIFIYILIYSIENKINVNEFGKILVNIKEKGDLTKIYKKDLAPLIKEIKKGPIYDAFIIINIFEKNDLLIFNENNIFKVLIGYPNLFLHSLQLFPDYSFLIKMANCINDLKIILKCSIGLSDMISFINENKTYISESILKNKSLVFYDIIGQNSFSEPFNQNIYSTLNDIKQYEKKKGNKILISNINIRLNMIRNITDITIQIRILLFEYIIGTFNEEEIIYNILSRKNKLIEFNNIELILLIDMLLNSENKNSNSLKYFIEFINKIEFGNINENFKYFFSKNIKWEIESYNLIITNIRISNANIEFILFLIDTLIMKSIENNNFKTIYAIFNKNENINLMNLLSKYVIDDDELFIKEDSINLKLLNNLYDEKFFNQKNNIYSETTITKLKNIFDRIINMKDLSYNNIIYFKYRINLLLLFDKNYEMKIIEIVNKNINFIEEIIQRITDIKNNLHFSCSKKLPNQLETLIDKFKSTKIKSMEMEIQINNFNIFDELFQSLKEKIKENYFFKKIKERVRLKKKIPNYLFEKIINIFDKTTIDEIDYNLIYNTSFFSQSDREKDNIINNLFKCYQLYKIIYFNFEKVIKYNYNEKVKDEILDRKSTIGQRRGQEDNNDDIIINKIYNMIIEQKETISYYEKNNVKNKILILSKITKIFEIYLTIKLKIIEKSDGNKIKYMKYDINVNMKMLNSFLLLFGVNPEKIFNYEENNLINMIKSKKPIRIINSLIKNIEALEFLLSITSQDCRNLRELAGEVHGGNNQNFLSIEELLFLEKIEESFENIKKGVNNDNEFITNLSTQIEEDELKNYIDKYQQFKEFFSENLDKNKFTSEIIQKILNNSEFMIINSNKNNFKAFYKNKGEEFKLEKDIYKEFDFNYMIYLRDRALTRYKITDSFLSENNKKNYDFAKNLQKEEKKIFENNQIFIKYVQQINDLLKLLDKITQRGYFYYVEDEENNKDDDIISYFNKIEDNNNISLLKIKIKIENNSDESYKIHYFLNGKKNKNFSDTYEIINNIYNSIIAIQRNAYLKKNYINFIYGKQFHLFFDYFYNQKINENFKCFLHYFTNCENLNLKSVGHLFQNLSPKNNNIDFEFYQNFIDQCEQFLDKLCKDKGLSLEIIYQQNKIKKDFEKMKGIYFNGTTNLENEIIQCYKFFTNNMPLAKTLLLCKQDTTIEELLSFLHRAINCKYHILFCLARTNYLSEDKKNFILETVSELLGEEIEENRSDKMNSFLIIMNYNIKDELFQSLFRLKYIKPLDIQRDKINTIKILENNDNIKTMLIYSDHSGVGKSTYIKNKAKEGYIYFPLGGNFTKENTLKRLQYLNNKYKINLKSNLLFHVDLFDTEQNSLMNDFLYFILITKLYGQDDNIFYLSKKIILYLEIPNSFIDFFDKYPILKSFPKKELSLENLEPLIVPNDICSKIKIVSLYLKFLKEENISPEKTSNYFKADNKIDKNEIIFPFTPPDIILKDANYDYDKIAIKAEEENKNLTQKVCQNLIMEEIKKTIEKPTYYQITTFINVLANQLIQFNRNYILSACTILDTGKINNCSVRSLIVRKFIDLTKYFTKGAFTELLNEQKSIQEIIHKKYNDKKKIEKANNILENHKHDSISFEKMDLALIFFHGGNNSVLFSIITNKKPYEDTYRDLLNLKNFQSGKDIIKRIRTDKIINLEEAELLTDYRKYSQKEFLEELKSILDLDNPVEIENKDNLEEKDRKISLMEMTKNYVITVDNFIKMCLILIRIRANVPIIMMGETGCGKTSLIRKLSELQNDGKCLLVIDNIHAGHTNEDIIKFIEEKVIPEAEKLSKQEEEKKTWYRDRDLIYEEKKLWIFFDELNTCKSMDLLSEIICKHSYQGKKLPENIVFIGAVNPYRKAKQKLVGLKINNNNNTFEESDLVYTVNPMPHSLLNFVFDFGNLNPDDEKRYITNMIDQTIKEKNLCNLAIDLIIISQNFIRKENGISSVSLREIRRFIIFYEFFIDYLKKRKDIIIEEKVKEKEDDLIQFSKLTDKEIQLYSINLSIYLGYYLRLTNFNEEVNGKVGLRLILLEKLNNIFLKESKNEFLILPENEENFIADNVELEKGIAKNRALLENLFSLFVAINTKIPIFIIGKPGCSKSLSIQLINNAMKGRNSNNSFFKKYPKMYVSTYQGALNSTSEGVKSIFDKAREILKVSKNNDKISTIYFDEMGLAEHSPYNPLKVIHSELEYDLNADSKKVSFLGISNWSLDSSKMNRGITISIPEPNEKDIIITSITIAKSYLGENLEEKIKIFFENLGKSFYKYKKEFKNNSAIKIYEDFHGNRDFYHLIKYLSVKIKETINNKNNINEKFLAQLAIKALGRNFGGLNINENKYITGLNIIIEKLSEVDNEVKNILKEKIIINYVKNKIMDNLIEHTNDYLSRYLLLITKSNIGIYLLTSFLKSINGNNSFSNYTILIGSMFIDDIQNEEYTSKILSKIKINIEKETILILKDFESIYTSLYDLFNQNFVKVKGKKYARIALGSKTNSFSEVNNNFRCIIVVDEDKIPEQEIPFLNRFEKQSLSFEYLMDEKQKSISLSLYEKCQNMIIYDEEKIKLINYNINNLLINCDEEEINGIVLMEKQNLSFNNYDYESIENKLVSKISMTLPQDIILIILKKKDLEINEENKTFYNKILENYKKNYHQNIKSFLSNYENKTNKIIIYTFTRIIDSIKKEYLNLYNIKLVGELNLNNIKQIRISSIQNESNLESEIEQFLEDDNLKVFILKLLPLEYSAIDYLKIVIENKEREYKNKMQETKNKLFIFIVHLERIDKNDMDNLDKIKEKLLIGTLSHLAGYSQIFIDDINSPDYFDNEGKIITLDKILLMKNIDLYKAFINKKAIFIENLNTSLCYFDYSFNREDLNKDNYINDLIMLFYQDEDLINIIDELIMKNICSKKNNEINLLDKILKEEKFSKGDICIFDLVKKVLTKNYLNEFKMLYVELEKNYYFSCILNHKKNSDFNDKKEFYKAIKEIFIKEVNLKNRIPENEIKLNIIIGFYLPSKSLLEKLINYISNNIIAQYRQFEEQFKNSYYEDKEFEEGKQEYENNIELLNRYTQDFLNKIELIKNFESKFGKYEKIKFYNLILEDYLLYFINKYYEYNKLSQSSITNIKEIIKIILSNKFGTYKDGDIRNISQQLNWIESYSMEIISIIKIFIFLDSFNYTNCNLIEKMKNNIKELNEEYDKIKITQNIKIINKPFYSMIGSLIKILISDLENILSNIHDQEKFNILLDDLNNIYYTVLSNDNNLNLSCKELFSFHEAIKIISILSFNNKEDKIKKDKKMMIDFIQKKIINKVKNEQKLKNINQPRLKKDKKDNNFDEVEETDEERNLKDNLKNYKNYYKEKNSLNFVESFSSVLFDEFNKEYNENYRKYILKIILDDDNLIKHNILLIKIIIAESIKPEKEYIDEALNYISNEETYFPLLNNCKKEILEKSIMKIFDSIINLYFDSLNDKESYIKSDLFSIYKEYICVLENKEYKKYYDNYCNENLVKLYTICFIKIYLNRFIIALCDNRNYLMGEENKIIQEISRNSSLSNIIQIYFIILLYHKQKSLELLKEKSFEIIENFSNDLRGRNNFKDILNKSLIPKEEKYLFSEYFSYIEYPSFNNFESKYLSSNENKEKYPLLGQYIQYKKLGESGPNNLKYLNDYIDFVNLMINIYSGKISRNEANKEERSLNLEEIYKDEIFRNKFEKFKLIWNEHLSKELKEYEKNKSDKFLDKFNGNETLAYFLNDDDEKGYGIFIANGLLKFIEWQNSFLKPIIRIYKSKKNNILSCYISQMEKTVNIQNINNLQILQIEKCFENTFYINFNELLSIYFERKIDNINDFEYNFEMIEQEIGKSLLPNKCLLNEKNIKYIIYQNEGFRFINYDLLIIFGKKYGQKELNDEDKKKILIYSTKEYNNFDIIFESFILFVNHLNNNYIKKDTKIIDFISEAKKKYIHFPEQFTNYFKEEGKDIVIEKLLNSILYMEHICFGHLKNKIDNRFKIGLNKGQKEEIINYFDKSHNDNILTKKEISSAVRRFITRYLLNDNKKENIDPNLNLYLCLERKFLWSNGIFSKIENNFNDLIKRYIGNFSFPLEVKHSFDFYNIIGEEEDNFILEEKNKFPGLEQKNQNKILTNDIKIAAKTLGLGGSKGNKKGRPKLKNKN